MAELYTDQMSSGVSGISTTARNTVEQAKLKITLSDNEKIPYDEAIKNVDRNLQNIIVETNNTLEKVRDEYQKRIDVQNCRSDLFWRVTGINTAAVTSGPGAGGIRNDVICTCTKLSPTYPKLENTGTGTSAIGFSTGSMMWYTGPVGGGGTGPGITTVAMGGDETLVSAGSAFDTYLQPDNLHGLLLYNEPYVRDIGDLFVATGIGTISAGFNTITLLTPNLNLGIKPGMVVTPSRFGIFAEAGNVVVGVSSTTMDLSPYSDVLNIGSASTVSVPLITLQDPSVSAVTAPGSDGKYTYFDFSKDPNLISDEVAVEITDNAYVPQVISLISSSNNFGKGVEIEYINNGASSSPQEWNKFMEGVTDPDLLPDEDVKITKPVVGADKIYYAVGFDQKPILLGGGNASEGDVRTFQGTTGFAQQAYASLSGCNDSDLNAAISARDDAEAALLGSNSFPEKISLVNSIRSKRNDIYITIWAYRTHIGNSENEFTANNSFMNEINSSPYKNLINTGTE
jgi:hypothetical protein